MYIKDICRMMGNITNDPNLPSSGSGLHGDKV